MKTVNMTIDRIHENMDLSMEPTAKCCRCGAEKSLGKLNGYDPISGDTSQAFCRRIAECYSQEAEDQLSELAAALT